MQDALRTVCLRASACAGALCLLAAVSRCSSTSSASCGNADQDGVNGGHFVFDLTVDDDAFAPRELPAQNLANVTLTLTNKGTRPHDFVVDCVPTPNDNGCPATSCFPDAATIGSLAPDASVTRAFVTPNPEGTYTFRSNLPGDTQTGQFIVQ